MTGYDIHTYEEGTTVHIEIENVETEVEKERIKDLLSAFLGVENEYAFLFNNSFSDDFEEDENDDMLSHIGSMNIIPSGEYQGFTVQDVYNLDGHESLVSLLLKIKKLPDVDTLSIDNIYKEAILYAISAIKRKEVDLEGFIVAYKPFLNGRIDGISGSVDEWLKETPEEQEKIYSKVMSYIIERMQKSIS